MASSQAEQLRSLLELPFVRNLHELAHDDGFFGCSADICTRLALGWREQDWSISAQVGVVLMQACMETTPSRMLSMTTTSLAVNDVCLWTSCIMSCTGREIITNTNMTREAHVLRGLVHAGTSHELNLPR